MDPKLRLEESIACCYASQVLGTWNHGNNKAIVEVKPWKIHFAVYLKPHVGIYYKEDGGLVRLDHNLFVRPTCKVLRVVEN